MIDVLLIFLSGNGHSLSSLVEPINLEWIGSLSGRYVCSPGPQPWESFKGFPYPEGMLRFTRLITSAYV